MKNIFVYYRTSDYGNNKDKLEYASKRYCLENAIEEFGKDNIYVIADNCNYTTIQYFKDIEINFEQTSLGNSESFRFMIDLIIKIHKNADYVYLLEDDYVHLDNSKQLIAEGLEIADYVTLYDSPDYYQLCYLNGTGSLNPLMWKQQIKSKIYVTQSTHWRESYSTTMTFATKVKVLKEDRNVWYRYTRDRIPDDFASFLELTRNNVKYIIVMLLFKRKRDALAIFRGFLFRRKKRLLINSIPGNATHTEVKYLSPVIKWNNL